MYTPCRDWMPLAKCETRKEALAAIRASFAANETKSEFCIVNPDRSVEEFYVGRSGNRIFINSKQKSHEAVAKHFRNYKNLSLHLTLEEHEAVKKAAEQSGMTINDWIMEKIRKFL